MFSEVRGDDAIEKLIELPAIPLPVHVSFPETDRSFRDDPGIEVRIVYLDIPRFVSVYFDARFGEQIAGKLFCIHGAVSKDRLPPNRRLKTARPPIRPGDIK